MIISIFNILISKIKYRTISIIMKIYEITSKSKYHSYVIYLYLVIIPLSQ
jgi:hypothetical protein